MSEAPRVSVLMAVRDGAGYIRPAIDSVLRQTVRNLELVVVDDGSTDATREILAAYADPRLVRVDNPGPLGLADSLNRGLAVARAEFVARQDADDRSHPARLEQQLAAFAARADLALVGAQARRIDARGSPRGVVARPLGMAAIRWYHLFANPFIHSAVMFRRSVVQAAGGFDHSLPRAQDFDLWSRILQRQPVLNLAARLVDYRHHATSVTESGRHAEEYARIVRRLVARNVEATLGERLDPAAATLLGGFDLGLERADVPDFVSLALRLAARFRERYPEAAREGEPDRTLSRQLDALAVRVRPATRGSALAVYRAGLGANPRLSRWLPWTRVLARLAVGPRLRRSTRA